MKERSKMQSATDVNDIPRAEQMGSIVRQHAQAMVRRIARQLLDGNDNTPAGLLAVIEKLEEAKGLMEASLWLG